MKLIHMIHMKLNMIHCTFTEENSVLVTLGATL